MGIAILLAPSLVDAHFILLTPDSWMSQNALGSPQKLGPCGDEGGGTPTGSVTAYHPGETIAVTIDEVIMHPGHYRVALAVHDRSELPEDPEVTPKDGDPCGSAAIQRPAVFPVLADGVLPHTRAFPEAQTFSVTLPADVTCARCTLQVVEYMSNHPAPCFYHHCADISIRDDGTSSTTLPGGVGGSTTTTIGPCPTPRCAVDAVVHGLACATDTIPAGIRHKLERGPALVELAESRTGAKARVLRRNAKRAFFRAGRSAVRASRGKKRKLSIGCAASIERTSTRLAGEI